MPDITPDRVVIPFGSKTDFEIWAPNDAAMQEALIDMGFVVPQGDTDTPVEPTTASNGVTADGIVWSLNYYGQKFAKTGNMVAGPAGPTPELTPLAGVFAALRWNGDMAKFPNRPNVEGFTVRPLPPDAPQFG